MALERPLPPVLRMCLFLLVVTEQKRPCLGRTESQMLVHPAWTPDLSKRWVQLCCTQMLLLYHGLAPLL